MPDRFVTGLDQLGIKLSNHAMNNEMEFLDELLRWNLRVNLTSIRNRNEAIEKHLLDSLVLLPQLGQAKQLLDIGSGGGLPGIPLAIASPALQVVSVDSVGKKINFQKHIKRRLQVDNLTVIQSRIEELLQMDTGQDKCDLVVSRAFSSLEVFIQSAVNWLNPGGRFVAMKGPEGRDELGAAQGVIEQYGFTNPEIKDYRLPFSQAERQLVSLTKS